LILFTVACVMAPIIFAALILAIIEARKLVDRLEK
jgi:uncharacterized membrane protein YhdT